MIHWQPVDSLAVAALLAAATVGPAVAGACSNAYNVRRFPLGTSGKRIVILEIDHCRTRVAKSQGSIGWRGTDQIRFTVPLAIDGTDLRAQRGSPGGGGGGG